MAYVYPDGTVTGSVNWDELRESVKNRDHEGVTKDGWARLDALVKEHDGEVKGLESEAEERAKAVADANVEAGAQAPAEAPAEVPADEEQKPAKKTAAKKTAARSEKES